VFIMVGEEMSRDSEVSEKLLLLIRRPMGPGYAPYGLPSRPACCAILQSEAFGNFSLFKKQGSNRTLKDP